MGPHVMRHLPKYVHGFIDRHGKARFYFRRAGFRRTTLPGLPWSPEFMAAYEASLATAPCLEIGARRTVAGTVNAVVIGYFASAGFQNLASASRQHYRGIIERFSSRARREADREVGKAERHRNAGSQGRHTSGRSRLSGLLTATDPLRNRHRLARRRSDHRY